MENDMQTMLKKFGINYEIITHELSGKTTEDAVLALGESKSNIIKSLLLENEKEEYLGVIIAGDKKIDMGKIKNFVRIFGITNIEEIFTNVKFSFAAPDSVRRVLGYDIGGVPPFAFYMHKIPTIVDTDLRNKEYAIGAGGTEYLGVKFEPNDLKKLGYVFADLTKESNIHEEHAFPESVKVKGHDRKIHC